MPKSNSSTSAPTTVHVKTPASKSQERQAEPVLDMQNQQGASEGKTQTPGADMGDEENPQATMALYQRFMNYVGDAVRFRRKKISVNAKESGKIPFGIKLSYALPQFSLTSLTMLIGIHGTIFYTKIGADVAFIAFFTALARSFDVITDPIMGYVSDKTKHKMGRRRPWMLGSCWGYALFFFLLFSPPEASGVTIALWFGIFYVIFYLFDTLANVPYSALGPELSDVSTERDNLFFWAKLVNGIGILVGAVGPVAVALMVRGSNADCTACGTTSCPTGQSTAAANNVPWDGSWGTYPDNWYNTSACNDDSFNLPPQLATWCTCQSDCDSVCDISVSRVSMRTVATMFGVYYFLTMMWCAFFVKERSTVQTVTASSKEPVATAPLVPSLLATLRNRPFTMLLPAWICDMTAYTMIGTMLPFYVEYVIVPSSVPECMDGKRAAFGLDPSSSESADWCKSETWLGFGLVALIGAQILSMPMWLKLTKCWGKFRTWLAFNLTTSVTNALFVFIGRGDPKACTILAIINGMPSGAQFLTDSIVADVIDYDEFLTGERSEGRFTIFQTFIPKIVSVPAQAIPLALMSFVGFLAPVNGVPQEQSSTVKWFISAVFFILPSMLALTSFFIKSKFPIRSAATTTAITKGAALHLKGKTALDPLTGKYVALFEFDDTKKERQAIWKLDNFFTSQLLLLLERGKEGPALLVKQMKRTLVSCAVLAIGFFVAVAASVAGGLLSNDKWSWLPAFGVIGLGMSCSALVFNKARYKVAQELVENPVDKDLLKRWVFHLTGADEPPAGSMVQVEHRMNSQRLSTKGLDEVTRVSLPQSHHDPNSHEPVHAVPLNDSQQQQQQQQQQR